MENLNSIQKFYSGKTVFITGGSGFMGKVLIEKLLYSCSDVKEILVLMREKRGVSGRERVENFKKLPMFQRIMTEKPEMMNKISPVYGELSKRNFDLSEKHLKKVVESTEIVFHLAASLKLEAPLKPNVMMNLIGTKNALELAKQMKNLIQMVHLSTAFCNVEPEVVYEKVYDFPHDPEDVIRMSEWMDDKALNAMQKELLGQHVNTYTYTKRLAEILVEREYGKLPVSIARPTVVLPALEEPVPGWVDSLNGMVGIFYAAGKGVLRSMLANPEGKLEFIPVDISINALILIPKILSCAEISKEIPVYHLTCHETQKLTLGRIFDNVKKIGRKYPMSWALWYPDGNMTMNRYENAIKVFLFQLVPAYIIDFLLFCFRQKRFMVHVQKRIADGAEVVQFFTTRQWCFKSDKFQGLVKTLTEDEYKMFQIDCENMAGGNLKAEYQYIENCIVGGRQYCIKDPLSTLPTARVMHKIQFVLHIFCKFLFYWFLVTQLLKVFGLYEPLAEWFSSGKNSFKSF